MIEGQLGSVAAVRAAEPAIEQAALAIEARLRRQGRLIYAGAGTSGRLAVQDGAELMPTFSWPADRLLLLLAGGDKAMTQAVEGAEDDTTRAAELIDEHGVDATDVLIATAASGTTPFTLTCLREARRRGALTVGIANNPGTPLLTDAEHPILLATGPEPIAGSTRMNAGTAQRITLNLLSTLVMIRLGRIYRGMMVEVQASNAKLARRREKHGCRIDRPERRPGARGARAVERQRQARRVVVAGLRPRRCGGRARSKSAASCALPSITSPNRPPSSSAANPLRPPPTQACAHSAFLSRNSYSVLHRGRFKSLEPNSHPVNMVRQIQLRSIAASTLMQKLAARGASRQGARTRGGPGGSGRRGRECRALKTEAAARSRPPNWQRLPGQTYRASMQSVSNGRWR